MAQIIHVPPVFHQDSFSTRIDDRIYVSQPNINASNPWVELNINGNTTILPVQGHNNYAGSSTPMSYDPMEKIAAWYGLYPSKLNCLELYDHAVKYSFWSRVELNEWLDKNLKGLILVQPFGGAFKMCFEKLEERGLVSDKLLTPKQYEKVEIVVPYASKVDAIKMAIEKWVAENLTIYEFANNHNFDRYKRDYADYIYSVQIRDTAEATAMKIYWSGIDFDDF